MGFFPVKYYVHITGNINKKKSYDIKEGSGGGGPVGITQVIIIIYC